MMHKNIFNATSFFSILFASLLVLASCARNEEYGTKTGEEGEEPEAYGLQEEDLPGMGDDNATQTEIEASEESYPADESPRGDVVAGEDNEAMEVEYGQADTTYDPQAAQYPTDKIKDETNLNSNDPMELDSDFESVQKKKLLATLNRHRTNLERTISDLKNAPGDSGDSSTIAGNVEKLKLYREKIDLEIAKVRAVGEENFAEVAENAQAALKGSGALMQSKDMRIQQGY